MELHTRVVGIGIDAETDIVLSGRKIRALGKGKAYFRLKKGSGRAQREQTISEPDEAPDPYQHLVDLTAWRRDAIDRTLEPFPAEKPPVPNVENGTLLIVGGGGEPDGMSEMFVKLAGGDKARLVYVPCSERDKVSRREYQILEEWKELGVESADLIHTKDRTKANSDSEFLKPLTTATGIWFGGGRQWNFADSYYGTEAHRLMKDVLKRGGVVGGSSAGASIQADYLARANPIGNIDIMADGYERGGLAFIRGVAIDQHFTQRRRQKDMTQLVNRYPQVLGIGVDETTALVVKKSIGTVIGEGKVFFYDRNQPVVEGEPDYTALSEGERFNLAERRKLSIVELNAPSDDDGKEALDK